MARVLLVSDTTLFGHGIERLLAGLPDIEIVGWTTDPAEAGAYVDVLLPDVLVVGCIDLTRQTTPALLGLLERGRVHKIIAVDLGDNSVHVLTSERRIVDEVSSLAEAITGSGHV